MITLIHPSRARADKALETLKYWLSKASGKIDIEHILSLDSDDPQLEKYKENFKDVKNSCAIVGENDCVVKATNAAAEEARGLIFIYLSDDFKCPDNWDLLLVNKFRAHIGPTLVKVNDCLQPFDVKVLTIPIMNKMLYDKLGYFWFQEYKSMFVDEDLFWVCDNNGWIVNAPELKFPHEHCSLGLAERDETYINSEKNWDQGKVLFAKRKAAGFPILKKA